jgi:hypothetical protein
VWSQQRKLVGTGAVDAAGQGNSVSLSGDGNTPSSACHMSKFTSNNNTLERA